MSATKQCIITSTAVKNIIPAVAVQDIIAVITIQNIIVEFAVQTIRMFAAVQCVIPDTAVKRVSVLDGGINGDDRLHGELGNDAKAVPLGRAEIGKGYLSAMRKSGCY